MLKMEEKCDLSHTGVFQELLRFSHNPSRLIGPQARGTAGMWWNERSIFTPRLPPTNDCIMLTLTKISEEGFHILCLNCAMKNEEQFWLKKKSGSSNYQQSGSHIHGFLQQYGLFLGSTWNLFSVHEVRLTTQNISFKMILLSKYIL